MPKLLMAATVALTLKSFLLPHAKYMRDQGWTVDGMASGIGADVACKEAFDSCFDIPWSRNPFDIRKMACAYKRVLEVVSSGRYDVVHLHTPVAAAVGRLALRKIRRSGRVKVVYTAHGFHFYKGAPLLNWLLYYPMERFLSRYTDVLITVNKEDYHRALTFNAAEVAYIPGIGVDFGKFRNCGADTTAKRRELGIPEDAWLLLSVGELNKNKNHIAVLRALSIMRNPAIHYMIAGEGPLHEYLPKKAKELDIEGGVHLLGYREDTPELYKVADCFVFPSLREGLPVALMEAAVSGLPIICSKIRGNTDIAEKYGGSRLFAVRGVPSLLEILQMEYDKKNKANTASLPEEIFSQKAVIEAVAPYYIRLRAKRVKNVAYT
ncbi:MAG: glycosyltransferase [bacterium]|nr:glycosyltransferase [bacterium]